MATASANLPKLRAIEVSPTTLQYALPAAHTRRPFYKRKFFPPAPVKDTLSQPWLWSTDPQMPKYPYAKDYKFEEANHGLYGGLTIQSGNKISDGRNKGRSMRKWYPNVRVEKLFSKALNVQITVPVVARVMRTIKKCGGLDEYVLGEKPARVKELGLLGWKLRWLIQNSPSYKTAAAAERARLGVGSSTEVQRRHETFADAWKDEKTREELILKVAQGWDELREKEQRFIKHVSESARWERRIPEFASLKLHDPMLIPLPATFVEQPGRQMPKVEDGYGLKKETLPEDFTSSTLAKVQNLLEEVKLEDGEETGTTQEKTIWDLYREQDQAERDAMTNREVLEEIWKKKSLE